MSEVTSALADANHSLDHVDTLRHLGRLPQPGLGQVQSHAGEGEAFLSRAERVMSGERLS